MIANVDPASLSHTCDMGYAAPASLAFVIEDYIRRLHHHPGQILGGGDPAGRDKWTPRTPG
ncbi:MAG TPA: hypothetical protein VMF59_12060 [Bacteroidota bacterium]|nr:hypothetical protein [Bacteroidota bacterium]